MSAKIVNQAGARIENHIGNKLKQRRQQLKLKQYEVAAKLGITFQQIHKYEKGIDRLSASRLLELSQILSVPISFFYEGLEPGPLQGKEWLFTCTNNQGKQLIIKFLDETGMIADIKVLSPISNKY